MANYPQLDDQVGVWKLKEVNDAVMGGYWRTGTTRALCGAGLVPGYTANIDRFDMTTAGNAVDFGELGIARGESGAMANFTRCIFAGGNYPVSPNTTNSIEYVNIATDGNGSDFGTLSTASQRATGTGGNATRSVFTEGTGDLDQILYLNPNSTGNSIDFGNRTVSGSFAAGVTSPTRVCFAGAFTPSVSNIIDSVEIATTGNAVDFGDLSTALRNSTGCSSSTRGVFIGGKTPSQLTTLDSVTIASKGNAIDYGDLTGAFSDSGGVSNSVTGFSCGGNSGGLSNVIQSFNISTGGNAVDFGDLTAAKESGPANSGLHGGLNNGYEGTRFDNIVAGAGRGFFAGYHNPGHNVTNDVIHISTLGNSNDFGD